MIRTDAKWSYTYTRLLSVETIVAAKAVYGFLYLLHLHRWQFVIPDHSDITSKLEQEFLINQAHVNSGHAELDTSYVELCNAYHEQNTYADSEEFVTSAELCQRTKSSYKEPVDLLITHNVPTRPCNPMAIDLLSFQDKIVDCEMLIPTKRLSDNGKPHCTTTFKVQNIVDRHSGYTYNIP